MNFRPPERPPFSDEKIKIRFNWWLDILKEQEGFSELSGDHLIAAIIVQMAEAMKQRQLPVTFLDEYEIIAEEPYYRKKDGLVEKNTVWVVRREISSKEIRVALPQEKSPGEALSTATQNKRFRIGEKIGLYYVADDGLKGFDEYYYLGKGDFYSIPRMGEGGSEKAWAARNKFLKAREE